MISYERRDAVATIEIADVELLSRHDRPAGVEVRDALVAASDDDEVKAIVLTSGRPHFCPDVGEQLGADEAAWSVGYAGPSGLYQALTFAKKVTITAVRGQCHGAGAMLVLCSDLTVAAEDATFGCPTATHPEANFVLAALTMRLNRAKAWHFEGRDLDARQALTAGLVTDVVPSPDLHDAAFRLARQSVRMPLDGVTMSKMMLQAHLDAVGVGQDFDMAGLYRSGARPGWANGVGR
jgi:enoyl-CoA hydratase/carnithine racemase